MILKDLIQDMDRGEPGLKAAGPVLEEDALHLEITSVHYRAQDVKPGGLFVAIPGHMADGHDFIDQAQKNGASAVAVQKEVDTDLLTLRVHDTRKALAGIAANFYGRPSQDLFIVGITGTNGKTTTSYLIENILAKAGYHTGVIGTINYRFSGKEYKNPVTTPESLDLQRILAQMKESGITHVIMEVSSHALDLHRTDHCWIDVGVFTNLTQDHLDYHQDMDAYWTCKKKLFTDILNSGPKKGRTKAVINGEDPKGKELDGLLAMDKITTGFSSPNKVRPEITKNGQSGMAGRIITPGGSFDFSSSLVGRFNQQNILNAVGVGWAMGISMEAMKYGIQDTLSIPGRLESIQNPTGRHVYVDFAHTPDALKNVLLALKAVSDRKMICIFGCGGDRDTGKRPQMGEIAGKHCDIAVVTSDNPRTEAPEDIIRQIIKGVRTAGREEHEAAAFMNNAELRGYVVEPDRKKAIRLGISIAEPGDTVLIAGKGHETYQILGKNTISFDDREEARKALKQQK